MCPAARAGTSPALAKPHHILHGRPFIRQKETECIWNCTLIIMPGRGADVGHRGEPPVNGSLPQRPPGLFGCGVWKGDGERRGGSGRSIAGLWKPYGDPMEALWKPYGAASLQRASNKGAPSPINYDGAGRAGGAKANLSQRAKALSETRLYKKARFRARQ
jgi:hypothetical protein